MRALATELSSKQTWKSRPAKSLVSPYHPLGRQSRISCICGQTRPPPLPRIARLLQNHASVCSISLTLFLRVGIHITMWCASGVWDFHNLTIYHSNKKKKKNSPTVLEELFHNIIDISCVCAFSLPVFHGGLCLMEEISSG